MIFFSIINNRETKTTSASLIYSSAYLKNVEERRRIVSSDSDQIVELSHENVASSS